MAHLVKWLDSGYEPQNQPNPLYPKGVDVDVSELVPYFSGKACTVGVPYPAQRCGAYVIECELCGAKVAVTTAGRPDDPRSVRMACKRL